ncbi:hypothetical protein E2C01_094504 [Portunus trituberculatus]|uniref:Uncharacterized protein n=1 Tax=Portunus trituberculatus TaxID=210409 RepID=A0A5B7K1U3_PORTR|nr:hypothetical protein [Portunus trituberculatus]
MKNLEYQGHRTKEACVWQPSWFTPPLKTLGVKVSDVCLHSDGTMAAAAVMASAPEAAEGCS